MGNIRYCVAVNLEPNPERKAKGLVGRELHDPDGSHLIDGAKTTVDELFEQAEAIAKGIVEESGAKEKMESFIIWSIEKDEEEAVAAPETST